MNYCFKSTVFTGDKKKCSGCSACAQICSHHAIDMREDEEGFLFPVLDTKKCVSCGICDRICPMVNAHQENILEKQYCFLSTVNKEFDYSAKSATIGLCTMIAESILNLGGSVFGVTFEEHSCKAKHVCITSVSDLDTIRNSKYLQSDTNTTFSEVKRRLLNDEYVLYIGTPCQIAGLKAFLKKKYEKLYTIDIVCHGVFSYKLQKKEIEYWENKYNAKVFNFKFRSKQKYPWILGGCVNFDIVYKNDKVKHIEWHGTYSPTYYSYAYSNDGVNYNLRESCYKCVYRDSKRYGDISVGDAWGVDNPKLFTMFNKKHGVSILICNTQKGYKFIDNISHKVYLLEIEKKDIFTQAALLPTNRQIPEARYGIYEKLKQMSYKQLISDKYYGLGYKKAIWRFKRKYLILELKNVIKRILYYK